MKATKIYPAAIYDIKIQSVYSQNTVILALASSDPRLFCTLHMYTVPLSSLSRFVRVRVSDEESTVLFP